MPAFARARYLPGCRKRWVIRPIRGNAWQIQGQPTFTYNHEAESGNRLTLPLGVGVAKTKIFGNTPWKFSVQYWHYVEKPDNFGPDFQIRFQVGPVVPLPW